MKDVSTAVRLIQDVSKMTSDGVFCLTSNEVHVLSAIPTEDRRSVENVNISDEVDLPTKKALGICWNIEKDTFGFNTNLGEKPLTRCGMLSMVRKIYDPLGFAAPFLLRVKGFFKYCARAITVGIRLCQMTTSKIGINGKENYSCWKY